MFKKQSKKKKEIEKIENNLGTENGNKSPSRKWK